VYKERFTSELTSSNIEKSPLSSITLQVKDFLNDGLDIRLSRCRRVVYGLHGGEEKDFLDV
jgi:hypothetical protein